MPLVGFCDWLAGRIEFTAGGTCVALNRNDSART